MGMLLALAQEAHETGGDATRLVLPEPAEMIWGTIAFLIFFGVMAWLVFPSLRKMLKEREERIKGELEKAEQARLDAEEQVATYQGRLNEARAQADSVIREAQTTAEEVRRDLIAKAEAEANRI